MEIKNLIFDFDGTIADTSSLIIATLRSTIEDMGLPNKEEGDLKSMIGIRLEDMPSYLWPGKEVEKNLFVNTYRKLFVENKKKYPVNCFNGVKGMLRLLHDQGYNMAIATSRSVESLRNFLQDLGLEDCFQMLVGGENVKSGKPSPEAVNLILEKMNWKAGETMVVGDMAVDILMGKGAGCMTCGVTYGNGTIEDFEKAGSDLVIDEMSGLGMIMID